MYSLFVVDVYTARRISSHVTTTSTSSQLDQLLVKHVIREMRKGGDSGGKVRLLEDDWNNLTAKLTSNTESVSTDLCEEVG